MALIRSIKAGKQSRATHSTEVDCTYNTTTGDNGELLLRLATYGSDHRKSGPKSSQVLQINSKIAANLISILYQTFPELSGRDLG